MPTCVNCGASYTASIYRTTICQKCGKELKTCKNCRFFSPGEANDCHETVDEPVLEKDRANFCGWFSPATDAGGRTKVTAVNSHARKAFAELFDDD